MRIAWTEHPPGPLLPAAPILPPSVQAPPGHVHPRRVASPPWPATEATPYLLARTDPPAAGRCAHAARLDPRASLPDPIEDHAHDHLVAGHVGPADLRSAAPFIAGRGPGRRRAVDPPVEVPQVPPRPGLGRHARGASPLPRPAPHRGPCRSRRSLLRLRPRHRLQPVHRAGDVPRPHHPIRTAGTARARSPATRPTGNIRRHPPAAVVPRRRGRHDPPAAAEHLPRPRQRDRHTGLPDDHRRPAPRGEHPLPRLHPGPPAGPGGQP